MWSQNYTPLAGSLGWSAFAASLPMVVLFYLLAVRRLAAWKSALASLAAAVLLAAFLYRMPPGPILAATLYGAAFGLLPIGWITFSAILLYRLTLETGQFEVIKGSLARLTTDRRLQALLVAFAFGAFIEGAAGSGVPVAVGAAILTGLGFSPLQAAGVCLLANTAPVAFAAIGTPTVTLALTTGLPLDRLSAVTGRVCAPLSLCVPAYLTVLVGGWRGLKGAFPAVLVCGISFATVQLAVSNLIGPQTTALLASVATMVSLVALLQVWQPRDGSDYERRNLAPAPVYSKWAVWRAWMPYLLLAVCVLVWGLPPVRALLAKTSLAFAWPALHLRVLRNVPVVPAPMPYAAIYQLDWLACAGTACLLAAMISAACVGISLRTFGRVFRQTSAQMLLPLVTIASVLGLAFVMNYSGATATLGLMLAATAGLFPFFSPMLGWVGVFLTGSDTSANALFGNLQVVTAGRLGLNPVLMAVANSCGGAVGKMISIQSIAVAVAATGMKTSQEAELFRSTFRHSVVLICAMGLLIVFYSYVQPGWVR
jgi:L-lactate transport